MGSVSYASIQTHTYVCIYASIYMYTYIYDIIGYRVLTSYFELVYEITLIHNMHSK